MIKFAVCDDEPFMLDDFSTRLSSYMDKTKLAYQINCFTNGRKILECNKIFDIIFLDIQMEKPDGMETAKQLRKLGFGGIIIFITVLKESVFDAFEVQAYDYLVKPLEDTRFHRTLERALKFLEQEANKNIVLQKADICYIVPFSQIVYCEVYSRKIYLHKQNNEIIDYYDKFDNLQKCIDNRFFRCHRSYLVNLDYVYAYEGGIIILSDGTKVPVSRLRKQEFIKALLFRMKGRH